jgi:hypothetical protein
VNRTNGDWPAALKAQIHAWGMLEAPTKKKLVAEAGIVWPAFGPHRGVGHEPTTHAPGNAVM